MPPTRRLLLAGSAAALAGGRSMRRAQAASAEADPVPSPPVPELAPLRLNTRALRKGLFFGCAVDESQLGDAALLAHVVDDCGMVVSEGSFKWAALQPQRGHFSFARADALMQFAARNRLRVRGHTLVWHEANPPWLEPAVTPQSAEKLLTGYIAEVCGHFRGKLAHWDVANEVLNPDDGQPLDLRLTPWLRALGPHYLDLAFHAAAEADPSALRVLNEFGTDYTLAWQERRRVALLKLLETLLARGVPVQAVGLQAHLDASETASLDQRVLARFVADIGAMGLKVLATELDVRDDGLPANIPTRDQAVASHAGAWLDAVLPSPAVRGLLTWGLTDRRSWLNDKFPRKDGLPQRPLPLDPELRPTPLWQAIAAAFDAAPAR
jgi:endo-1,4-beta-xylanase